MFVKYLFVRDTDSPGGDKKRRYLVQSMGKARERFQAASGNTQVQHRFRREIF